MKKLIRLAVLAAIGAAAIGVPGAGTAVTQPLLASVGPGFSITLTDSTGTPVSHLDPGTYTINVTDKGTLHNFHLQGPGVDQASDVDRVENVSWTVTVTDGRYTYLCDAHPTQMRKTFTVGNVPPPPAKPKKLFGSVGPGKRIALRNASGRKVASVVEGTYTVAVSDRTRADNFHLIGPNVNRKTTVRGRGTKTWKVVLDQGTYRYRSDASRRKLRGSFRVVAS